MIHLHFRHVVARGEVVRRVECEKCRRPFEYMLARKAALDTVPLPPLVRSAERIVRERVGEKLATGVDPHPCPWCGWVQAAMVPELRRRFCGPLRTWGVFFAVASAFLAMTSVAMGWWYPRDGLDMDWYGVAAASAGGCALGASLVGVRHLLGRLRYRTGGHYRFRPAPVAPARAA
jgi:hypothetical protein